MSEEQNQEATEEVVEATEAEAPEAAEASDAAEAAEPSESGEAADGELTLEGLELAKPLDKMTVKELRDLSIEKIPQITGASGMEKDDLLAAIKEILGIEDEGPAVSPHKQQISLDKQDIRDLREKRLASGDRQERNQLRRRINRLKKRTRRLAKTA